MEPQIQYCTSADGTSIACVLLGAGEPPAILVSHWTVCMEYKRARGFDSTLEAIALDRRAVAYDRRGIGYSARSVADVSLGAQLADIDAVASLHNMPRFALVGVGDGAFIASVYAARNPDRVIQLAITSPAIIGGDVPASVATLIRSNWGLGRRALADLTFAAIDAPLRAEFLASVRRAISPEIAAAYLDEQAAWSVGAELRNVTAPTLVVHVPGGSAEAARELAAAIPGARFAQTERTISEVEAQRRSESADLIRAFLRGESAPPPRRQRRPDNVAGSLRTVLFTDIADSTSLTQRLGDANAQDLLRTHNAIVRQALAACGGSEIKHTGDGIMASFPTASGALECAVAIQRGMPLRGDSDLAVHIGLNAGEPVAEEQDLFGTAVQLARRICDHAESGEIMASDVVRQLAAGKGFLFNDRGEVALRGFEDPVRLYEVRWREEP